MSKLTFIQSLVIFDTACKMDGIEKNMKYNQLS